MLTVTTTPEFQKSLIESTSLTFTDLVNESDYTFFDVTSEQYREYVYLGKGTIRIDNPVAVAVSKSGHRVLDADGVSHFISGDFDMIHWMAKPGCPHFVR
jgi:hypothetical protein